jgi:hypothetical protein
MVYNFLRTVADETGRRRTSTSTEASPHEQKQKHKATTTTRALQQRDKTPVVVTSCKSCRLQNWWLRLPCYATLCVWDVQTVGRSSASASGFIF